MQLFQRILIPTFFGFKAGQLFSYRSIPALDYPSNFHSQFRNFFQNPNQSSSAPTPAAKGAKKQSNKVTINVHLKIQNM